MYLHSFLLTQWTCINKQVSHGNRNRWICMGQPDSQAAKPVYVGVGAILCIMVQAANTLDIR